MDLDMDDPPDGANPGEGEQPAANDQGAEDVPPPRMEREEKPRLALAFEALDFPFKDKMDICGSKRFPPNLIEYVRKRLEDDWSDQELLEELSDQADALVPELLKQAEAENKKKQQTKEAKEKEDRLRKEDEAKKKAREKKDKDDEAREKKDEARAKKNEKREKAAADRDKKADDRQKKADDERKKEEDKRHKEVMKRRKEEEDARKAEEKKRKDEEKARQKEEERIKKEEEKKKKEEEKKKKEEEKRQKEEEDRVKKEEIRRKKEAEDEKKEEEKRKKEEEKRQKEEEKREKEKQKRRAAAKKENETEEQKEKREKEEKEEDKKDEERRKAGDERARREEDNRKKREEDRERKEKEREKKAVEDKKKREEKAKKDEEDRKKREEDRKKKEEEREKKAVVDKRKREEKARKDEEDRKKKERERERKKEEDKRKAEEKKKKDEEDKEKKAKKDEENKKKKEEEDKKKAAAAKKKKEQDDKRKEQEKGRKEKEKKRKDEQKERDDKRKASDKKRREEQKKRDEEAKRKEQEEKKKKRDEKEEWDEETGHMVKKKEKKKHRQKKKKVNHPTYAEDVCCGNNGDHPAGACRACCCMLYWMVIPPLFGALCFLEYQTYGLHRVLARASGDNYTISDFTVPTPSPTEWNVALKGKPPPFDPAKAAEEFLYEHPFSLGLPAIGLVFGLFANLCPIAPGLILVPLFEHLDLTKTAQGSMELSMWTQFIGSGVLGFMSWCGRDVRFFICRALFLLTPIMWMGYTVGVTHHLSFKDLLLEINEDVDDEGFREVIDQKSDCNVEGGCAADINKIHTYMRIGFGAFMLFMSFWVLIGVCIGGMNRYCCPSRTGGSTPGCKSFCQWMIVMACTFNTGYFFEANIGCGAGLTTFFLLSLFLGVETKRAFPTSIVMGGWSQIVPLALNYYYRGDQDPTSIPYVRLMMMFPGLWFGSLIAPWFSRCGGPMCDLFCFFVALVAVGTGVVCWGALQLQEDREDVDINVHPLFGVPDIDAYYDAKEEAADGGGGGGKQAAPKKNAGGGGKGGGGKRELVGEMVAHLSARALEYVFDVDLSSSDSLSPE